MGPPIRSASVRISPGGNQWRRIRLRETIRRYLQVGRQPAFRRFWLGMMISRAGDAFTTVALSWIVLGIVGPFQLGVVLMCFGLPRANWELISRSDRCPCSPPAWAPIPMFAP
jgi:hypothetical protein